MTNHFFCKISLLNKKIIKWPQSIDLATSYSYINWLRPFYINHVSFFHQIGFFCTQDTFWMPPAKYVVHTTNTFWSHPNSSELIQNGLNISGKVLGFDILLSLGFGLPRFAWSQHWVQFFPHFPVNFACIRQKICKIYEEKFLGSHGFFKE